MAYSQKYIFIHARTFQKLRERADSFCKKQKPNDFQVILSSPSPYPLTDLEGHYRLKDFLQGSVLIKTFYCNSVTNEYSNCNH